MAVNAGLGFAPSIVRTTTSITLFRPSGPGRAAAGCGLARVVGSPVMASEPASDLQPAQCDELAEQRERTRCAGEAPAGN